MNQLIMESNLENKFKPSANERNRLQKLSEKPSDLAIKLAKDTISKIKIR